MCDGGSDDPEVCLQERFGNTSVRLGVLDEFPLVEFSRNIRPFRVKWGNLKRLVDDPTLPLLIVKRKGGQILSKDDTRNHNGSALTKFLNEAHASRDEVFLSWGGYLAYTPNQDAGVDGVHAKRTLVYYSDRNSRIYSSGSTVSQNPCDASLSSANARTGSLFDSM